MKNMLQSIDYFCLGLFCIIWRRIYTELQYIHITYTWLLFNRSSSLYSFKLAKPQKLLPPGNWCIMQASLFLEYRHKRSSENHAKPNEEVLKNLVYSSCFELHIHSTHSLRQVKWFTRAWTLPLHSCAYLVNLGIDLSTPRLDFK